MNELTELSIIWGRKMNQFFLVFSIICAVIFLNIGTAHAYIDPGSGSAIISMIIGIFVAIGLGIKSFWYKITGFFRRGKTDTDLS